MEFGQKCPRERDKGSMEAAAESELLLPLPQFYFLFLSQLSAVAVVDFLCTALGRHHTKRLN